MTERRTTTIDGVAPYKDTIYRPWADHGFNALDPRVGAFATTRHRGKTNLMRADGSAKRMNLALGGISLHRVDVRDDHPAPR